MSSHCRFQRYRNADLIHAPLLRHYICEGELRFSSKVCDKLFETTRQNLNLPSQAFTKTLHQCHDIGKQAIGNIWHR
jgi:hypothetical protein